MLPRSPDGMVKATRLSPTPFPLTSPLPQFISPVIGRGGNEYFILAKHVPFQFAFYLTHSGERQASLSRLRERLAPGLLFSASTLLVFVVFVLQFPSSVVLLLFPFVSVVLVLVVVLGVLLLSCLFLSPTSSEGDCYLPCFVVASYF